VSPPKRVQSPGEGLIPLLSPLDGVLDPPVCGSGSGSERLLQQARPHYERSMTWPGLKPPFGSRDSSELRPGSGSGVESGPEFDYGFRFASRSRSGSASRARSSPERCLAALLPPGQCRCADCIARDVAGVDGNSTNGNGSSGSSEQEEGPVEDIIADNEADATASVRDGPSSGSDSGSHAPGTGDNDDPQS
jgi:hypothetical protein